VGVGKFRHKPHAARPRSRGGEAKDVRANIDIRKACARKDPAYVVVHAVAQDHAGDSLRSAEAYKTGKRLIDFLRIEKGIEPRSLYDAAALPFLGEAFDRRELFVPVLRDDFLAHRPAELFEHPVADVLAGNRAVEIDKDPDHRL